MQRASGGLLLLLLRLQVQSSTSDHVAAVSFTTGATGSAEDGRATSSTQELYIVGDDEVTEAEEDDKDRPTAAPQVGRGSTVPNLLSGYVGRNVLEGENS